jgi:hypothetical protein
MAVITMSRTEIDRMSVLHPQIVVRFAQATIANESRFRSHTPD